MTAMPGDLLGVDESGFDRWIESALPAAGQGINIIECIFDAEAVIIGGQMPQSLVKKNCRPVTFVIVLAPVI